jgi:hypothetical protein
MLQSSFSCSSQFAIIFNIRLYKSESVDLEPAKTFADDIDWQTLETQLSLLPLLFTSDCKNLSELIKFFRGISAGHSAMLSEVGKLVKTLLLVLLPATNAASERVFSTLRRVKTYTRSSMLHSCLNHILLCVTYKNNLTKSFYERILKTFVNRQAGRLNMFELPK